VNNCGNNLGNTYGQPVIRRLHNGMWGVIFGNGFGSSSGDGGIFVMTIDATSGARTFYYLTTAKGSSKTPNGIAYVYPADLDGDRIVDYVYAGDLLGNIWRFDLTATTPASWAASATPLFSTPSGQPITTKPAVWITTPTGGGTQRLMVDFGTGQKTPITNSTPATYVGSTQYLYGIWDWNMDSWNKLSSTKYYSLTAPQTIVASGASQNLQTQTATVLPSGEMDGTANPVCWKGSTTCTGGASANTQFGWVMALPGPSEQVVFNPIAYRGAFVVNTTIPANTSIASCANSVDTGYTIAISVMTGGTIQNLFPGYRDAIGFRTDGSGSVTTVNAGGKDYWLTQSTDGPGPQPTGVCPPPLTWSNGACSFPPNLPKPTGRRLTWIEKR
jgi:type IV pilus assembly protein PilY1